MRNPYQPPEASLEGSSPPRQGSLWKIIPIGFLSLFGGMLVLILLPMALSLAHSDDYLRDIMSARTVGGLMVAAAGGLVIASGALFWRGKWLRATLCLVLGYATGVSGSYLMITPPTISSRPG